MIYLWVSLLVLWVLLAWKFVISYRRWKRWDVLRRETRYRETLVRIAGTPTKSSSPEAKAMAKVANDALKLSVIEEAGLDTDDEPHEPRKSQF